MAAQHSIFRLYAVTDRFGMTDEQFFTSIEEALKGGITCLQLREKHLSDEDFLKEALQIGELCRDYGVPLIINDRVLAAKQCRADGVHIGQDDMRLREAREILGNSMMIGVSAHSVEEALTAQQQGADYLGVGAAFGSTTKEDAHAIAHSTIAAICQSVSVPVVAIGGITQQNVLQLKGTGIDGIAVISAVFRSDDPQKACRELLALFEQCRKG